MAKVRNESAAARSGARPGAVRKAPAARSPGSWMNIRALEIFATVYEEKSLTAAATRLHLTQSAVSQAIANLEATFEHQLLDRSMRPPKPTMVGTLVFEQTKKILNGIAAIGQSIEFQLHQHVPVMRLAMAESFASTAGPALIKEINELAAEWRIGSASTDLIVEALIERRFDFILTFDASKDERDLISFPIFSEPFVVVAPPCATGEAPDLRKDGEPLDFINYRTGSSTERRISEFLLSQNWSVNQRYEFDTSDCLIAMVKANVGWTITTPLNILKTSIKHSSLMIREIKPAPLRNLRLLTRRTDSQEIAKRIAEAARRSMVALEPRLTAITPWHDFSRNRVAS